MSFRLYVVVICCVYYTIYPKKKKNHISVFSFLFLPHQRKTTVIYKNRIYVQHNTIIILSI